MSPVAQPSKVPSIEPLYTPGDIAHVERVSIATVYRRYKAGFYPGAVAFKQGTLIRFRPDLYRAWVHGDLQLPPTSVSPPAPPEEVNLGA